jgi:hypothetical protein
MENKLKSISTNKSLHKSLEEDKETTNFVQDSEELISSLSKRSMDQESQFAPSLKYSKTHQEMKDKMANLS